MLLCVLICCCVYWYVAMCIDMLLCVLTCCWVYWHVAICIDMLLFVLTCCCVYWHVAMCIDMLLCVLTCCCVYWHVAVCIDMLLCVFIYSVWLILPLLFPQQMCLEQEQVFPVSSNQLFSPIDIKMDASPLTGCVLSVRLAPHSYSVQIVIGGPFTQESDCLRILNDPLYSKLPDLKNYNYW